MEVDLWLFVQRVNDVSGRPAAAHTLTVHFTDGVKVMLLQG